MSMLLTDKLIDVASTEPIEKISGQKQFRYQDVICCESSVFDEIFVLIVVEINGRQPQQETIGTYRSLLIVGLRSRQSCSYTTFGRRLMFTVRRPTLG